MRADIKERIEKINRGEVPEGYKKTKVGIMPDDWNVRKLDDVVEINPKKEVLNDEEEVSFIAMEDISNEGRIIKRNTKSYGEVNKGYTFFKNDDVLLAKITPCFENGKKALASKLTNNIGFGSTEFHVIRANNHDIIPSYIYYIISTNRFIHQAEANMTGTAGQKRVPTNFLREYKMCIPSLKEQQEIASILSTWDKAIELKEKLIQQKKELKKSLMENLLTGKVRLKGFDSEWKEVKIGNIGKTFTGLSGKSKDDFGTGKPYIPYKNIFANSKVDITNMDYVSINENDNQNKVEYGDILFTTSSEIPEEVGISSVLLDQANELYLNSFCFGFRLNNFNVLLPEFARFYFRGSDFRKKIIRLSQGSTRFNLSKSEVLKLKIKLPKLDEQKRIASILSTADKEIKLQEKELENLKEQKKGLMNLLLTGKVRVEC